MDAGSSISQRYQNDGYVSPVQLISDDEAKSHRAKLEEVEREYGSLHYRSKIHTLLSFAADLATSKPVLDAVEQILGPDILLYDCTYITKEPQTDSHVSWHQDLTYWGLSGDEQVTLWLALSPATEISGCMRMIPESHKQGKVEHIEIKDENNVLFRGQNVTGVDESRALMCPLEPGQASFHHGWTLHASMPNRSNDRRIGFNVQYITPSMKQTINPNASALMVRGNDRFNHYKTDIPASGVMEKEAVEYQAKLDKATKETWTNA